MGPQMPPVARLLPLTLILIAVLAAPAADARSGRGARAYRGPIDDSPRSVCRREAIGTGDRRTPDLRELRRSVFRDCMARQAAGR